MEQQVEQVQGSALGGNEAQQVVQAAKRRRAAERGLRKEVEPESPANLNTAQAPLAQPSAAIDDRTGSNPGPAPAPGEPEPSALLAAKRRAQDRFKE